MIEGGQHLERTSILAINIHVFYSDIVVARAIFGFLQCIYLRERLKTTDDEIYEIHLNNYRCVGRMPQSLMSRPADLFGLGAGELAIILGGKYANL